MSQQLTFNTSIKLLSQFFRHQPKYNEKDKSYVDLVNGNLTENDHYTKLLFTGLSVVSNQEDISALPNIGGAYDKPVKDVALWARHKYPDSPGIPDQTVSVDLADILSVMSVAAFCIGPEGAAVATVFSACSLAVRTSEAAAQSKATEYPNWHKLVNSYDPSPRSELQTMEQDLLDELTEASSKQDIKDVASRINAVHLFTQKNCLDEDGKAIEVPQNMSKTTLLGPDGLGAVFALLDAGSWLHLSNAAVVTDSRQAKLHDPVSFAHSTYHEFVCAIPVIVLAIKLYIKYSLLPEEAFDDPHFDRSSVNMMQELRDSKDSETLLPRTAYSAVEILREFTDYSEVGQIVNQVREGQKIWRLLYDRLMNINLYCEQASERGGRFFLHQNHEIWAWGFGRKAISWDRYVEEENYVKDAGRELGEIKHLSDGKKYMYITDPYKHEPILDGANNFCTYATIVGESASRHKLHWPSNVPPRLVIKGINLENKKEMIVPSHGSKYIHGRGKPGDVKPDPIYFPTGGPKDEEHNEVCWGLYGKRTNAAFNRIKNVAKVDRTDREAVKKVVLDHFDNDVAFTRDTVGYMGLVLSNYIEKFGMHFDLENNESTFTLGFAAYDLCTDINDWTNDLLFRCDQLKQTGSE